MKLKRSRGFSLIEVILTLVLLGAAMTILSQAFTNTLIGLDLLNVETDRQGVLRFVRAQVLQINDREEFEKGGEIETLDLGTAVWRAEVEETNVADLFKVYLEIELDPPNTKERLRERYKQEIHILRPTWSDPVKRSTIIGDRKRLIEDERRFR